MYVPLSACTPPRIDHQRRYREQVVETMRITAVSARLEHVERISNSREESAAFPTSFEPPWHLKWFPREGKYRSVREKHLTFQSTVSVDGSKFSNSLISLERSHSHKFRISEIVILWSFIIGFSSYYRLFILYAVELRSSILASIFHALNLGFANCEENSIDLFDS